MEGSEQLNPKLALIDVSIPSSPRITYNDARTTSEYQYFYPYDGVRYLPEDTKFVLPISNWDIFDNYTGAFDVYDISETSITLAFKVEHPTTEMSCWYDDNFPPRSFVIQSELTTIVGHTAIRTMMKSGSFISEIDFDAGFKRSICDPWGSYA
jgi:hypothetical protein